MRLNLVRFDGSYIMPLYLAYRPPQMLPTTTLNPLTTASAAPTGGSRVRRALADEIVLPLNHKVLRQYKASQTLDLWWWFGVAATGLGGVLYFCF